MRIRSALAVVAPFRVAGVRTTSRIWNVLSPDQQQRLLRLIRILLDTHAPRHDVGRMQP